MNKVKATKNSWKTKPLPEQKESFLLNRTITEEEFELIQYGSIPEAMEDKWFIYFEDSKLYFHRSWTGICIYIAEISQLENNFIIGDVLVNRNKEEYKKEDIKEDKYKIDILINRLIKQPQKSDLLELFEYRKNKSE